MSAAVQAARGGPLNEITGFWNADLPADADAIAEWQLQRAWSVVEHVAGSNPFYASWLSVPQGRDAAAFRTLRLTRKDDVVADCQAHPPYGSRTVCADEDIVHIVETSGTSGKGKEVYALDDRDEQAVHEAEATGFWWAGVRPGTRVLLCLPVTMQAAGKWYYGGMRRIGANVFPAGSYGTERKITVLRDYRCEVVVTTPSYLARLTEAAQEMGLDPARDLAVRSIMIAGEPYGLEWARRMQEVWGAHVFEQYGCTERGMGWACPPGVVGETSLRTLHFPPENAYVEVIDRETGEHVGDGELGELVVTPLVAAASPLVRFATGDRVRYVAPGSCDCGRPLGGIAAGLVYRYDDMMKVRGTNLWPGALDAAILGLAGVADYRGVVRHDDKHAELIEVRAEVEEGHDDAVRLIAGTLKERFGLSVSVEVCAPGALANAENATQFVKVKRWRDERSLQS